MAVQTAAKTKIYISNAVSTATTEAELAAETYTVLGNVESIPEFGAEDGVITFTPINDGLQQKFKGSTNAGSINVTMGFDSADSGQALLRTARVSKDDYAFKVVFNDAPATGSSPTPSVAYFRGKVMSYRINPGNADSVVMASSNIELTLVPVIVEAATGD